jgi:hypothetical protein
VVGGVWSHLHLVPLQELTTTIPIVFTSAASRGRTEAAMTRKATGTAADRRIVPGRSKPDGVAMHSLESAPRKTGIRAMGDMPWGTHICVFYETKNDLLETNAAYIEAGLASNEFCVWAVSEPTSVDEAKGYLRRNIAEFDRYSAADQLEILPGHDWYLRGNEFDLQRITRGWHEKLRSGLSKGFDEMRVSGNAFWMEANRQKEFLEYERELDQSLAGQNMIAMCTYSPLKVPSSERPGRRSRTCAPVWTSCQGRFRDTSASRSKSVSYSRRSFVEPPARKQRGRLV